MITSLKFHKGGLVPHWDTVPALASYGETPLEFKKGINLLWGPNGVGKSTIIKAIAKSGMAEETGRSKLASGVAMSWLGFGNDDKKPYRIPNDGQTFLYFDPSITYGTHGGAHFDDDNFMLGLQNMMSSNGQSTGQFAREQLIRVLHSVGQDTRPTFGYKRQEVNDQYQKVYDEFQNFFMPVMDTGPVTLLMDEPERSFDIPNRAEMWDSMFELVAAGHLQIIVASHDPLLLLETREIHVIDLEPGYFERCKTIVTAKNHA